MNADDVIDEIRENCKLLYDGYYENVEFAVEVAYHRGDCRWHGRASVPKDDCECPVVVEKRVRRKKRHGLLQQLREFSQNRDTDRELKAERGAPRTKVAGRPPGDMEGFFTLDEIECNIPYVVDRALTEAGRDRTWAAQPTRAILMGLAGQTGFFIEAHPDQALDILRATRRWVEQARASLRISTRATVFESVTCGNCGGALSTPAGNRGETDVRCIGTPEQPPCGETYPPGEWLELYQRMSQDRARREGTTS